MFKVLWLPESISSQTGGYMIQLLILKTEDIPILTYLMANKAHYRGLPIDLKTAGSIFRCSADRGMARQRAMSPAWQMRQVYALHPSK
jgi:hypothetical protein